MKVFFQAIPCLFMIIVVIGGIISGIFTATEGSVVAVVYSMVLSIFFYKSIRLRELPKIFLDSAEMTGIIIFLIGVSSIMSWVMAFTGIPTAVSEAMLGISTNRYVILFIINILLLIVGALAMSGALSSTGAGDLIGGHIAGIVDSVNGNSYIIGFIFFIIPFAMTQVMQNRGTMLIFHPIAIATCASIGANPVGLMILIQAACLSAFMTPMACGGYDQRSMFKQSWLFAIICCVVSVGWIMTVFPLG